MGHHDGHERSLSQHHLERMKLVPIHSTGVLLVENAVPPEDRPRLMATIEARAPQFKVFDRGDVGAYDRWFPCMEADRDLYEMVDRLLDIESAYAAIRSLPDYSWKRFSKLAAPSFDLQVTRYRAASSDCYCWHVDHIGESPNRALNFIFYLKDDFEGGELEIANEQNLVAQQGNTAAVSLKPRAWLLVLMPWWQPHRVRPVKSGGDRLTVNGHLF